MAGWIILPQVNPHPNTQCLSHCLMRPEGLGRCVQLKPLRWGVSWSSWWGRCDHSVLMKGKQEWGRRYDREAEFCAMHSENGRWPPAKECGQPLEAARKARKGTHHPPHQPVEGTSSASTFLLGLPDFSLPISRTVGEWICVYVGGGSLKQPKETNTEGFTYDLCSSKLYRGWGLEGEGRFGVHQLRQPLLKGERELGGLLETLKLGTWGQVVGGDSSVGRCKVSFCRAASGVVRCKE